MAKTSSGSSRIRHRPNVWMAVAILWAVHPLLAQSSQSPGNLESKVDAYLKPYQSLSAFSGQVLMARGGRILLSKAYGMANYELEVANTTDTKIHIASLSKTFTAASILLLQQRGSLSVQEPLAKYLPDYPHGTEITIHHLLTHTSGIPDINGMPAYDTVSRYPQTPASLIAVFRDKPLMGAPGSRYRYSNSNYNLLAFIIEKESGDSYGEFVRKNLLEPRSEERRV